MKHIGKIISSFIFIILLTIISTSIDYFFDEKKENYIYETNSYIVLNQNKPEFKDEDYKLEPFEKYSSLDELGRAGAAFALISKDMMPTNEREDISSIKPTGFKVIRYDFIEGEYLYNRCHLIAYQLTAENANEKNLITCTREMNAGIMLEFENKVASYIRKTNDYVLYRVTPIYEGDNLIASGVQIEASSYKDKCGKICFNVYLYNKQERVMIDYATGNSKLIS